MLKRFQESIVTFRTIKPTQPHKIKTLQAKIQAQIQ